MYSLRHVPLQTQPASRVAKVLPLRPGILRRRPSKNGGRGFIPGNAAALPERRRIRTVTTLRLGIQVGRLTEA